jgi:hypothetical protein
MVRRPSFINSLDTLGQFRGPSATPQENDRRDAALLPKQVEVNDFTKPVTRMTDAELEAIIREAQAEGAGQ